MENNRKWISKVADDMDTAVGGSNVEALLAELIETVHEVKNMGVYLDGKRVVGILTDDVDEALGWKQVKKARA